MSISNALRYQIFERDCFTCRYCGAAPPGVRLELEHVIPVSKGGSDEAHNLVTACFHCNRGKHTRDATGPLAEREFWYDHDRRVFGNAETAIAMMDFVDAELDVPPAWGPEDFNQ